MYCLILKITKVQWVTVEAPLCLILSQEKSSLWCKWWSNKLWRMWSVAEMEIRGVTTINKMSQQATPQTAVVSFMSFSWKSFCLKIPQEQFSDIVSAAHHIINHEQMQMFLSSVSHSLSSSVPITSYWILRLCYCGEAEDQLFFYHRPELGKSIKILCLIVTHLWASGRFPAFLDLRNILNILWG